MTLNVRYKSLLLFQSKINEYRQCAYHATLRRAHVITIAVEYTINIAYSYCVFEVFVLRHAKRMCRIRLSSAACLAVPYISTFPASD